MRTALIQMSVAADREENIARACAFLREAAARDTDVAVLPEMFCCPYQNHCFRPYGEAANGPAQAALSALAAELGMYVVGGSLPELSEGRVYNTSYVYDRQGREIAKHRKVHLFDIDVAGGQRFRESDTLSPGDQIPPLRRSLASWGFVSALTCALRNSPAACACGVPGSFSSRRPST